MKKLLVFSDLEGTIDEADFGDFINLFDLIGKYCEKKGYDIFSFAIMLGEGNVMTKEYYSMLSQVKQKIDEEIRLSIFSGLLPGAQKGSIESVVRRGAVPVGYNIPQRDLDDLLITKEVIVFDDCPHDCLKNASGKEYFESKYEIEYQCVTPLHNIEDVIEHFESALTKDEGKGPLEKTNNQANN